MAVNYGDVTMKVGFRADIIVEDKIILELKSVDQILPLHHKVLLTYLRLTKLKLGLLINFKEPLIKNGSNGLLIILLNMNQLLKSNYALCALNLCVIASLRDQKLPEFEKC